MPRNQPLLHVTVFAMEIIVPLPDDLAQHPNPGREALEALVLQGYRAGTLSQAQKGLPCGRPFAELQLS
ncbi:MAG TPA: hypothetical protein VI685_17425 [Candidatus Angelobacter sp.]